MIEELRIHDLGVIAEATVPLGPGLTVLTGETGAGKTMVVTALGLLLGAKPEPALVRRGARAAAVEARVAVDPEGDVAAATLDAGGVLDGDELLLGRTVPAQGRARAFAGGRAVPTSVLSSVAGELVALHGQSDQLLLRSPARQRGLLDRYAATLPGGRAGLPDEYRSAYRGWRAAEEALREFDATAERRQAERDQVAAGLALVEAVAPEPGEDARLDEEWGRLAHVEQLLQAGAAAGAALDGGDGAEDEGGAVARLAGARAALEAARAHDATAAALADRAAELVYLAQDVAADVASYTAGLDADPGRLAQVGARRQELARLARVHGDVGAALEWADRARERLGELGDPDRRDELVAAEADARALVLDLGGRLRVQREAAAESFASAVTGELAALALPRARVEVALLPVEPGPEGLDEVEIRLAAHSSAEALPIARAASGGELSRVMLGVEVVVGAVDPVATFVFDEVDAGVGGAAALGVGRRLATLAGTAQVIVVTHLAQVAAFADHHLVVEKADDGSRTESRVEEVTGGARVREIARMLAGDASSPTALAHAEELLEAAAGDVARPGAGRA